MRQLRSMLVFMSLTAVLPAVAEQELAVALEAIRDGLWSVARLHANRSAELDAHLVVVDSYAREGKWSELLAASGEWADAEVIAYYRALAYFSSGRVAQAETELNQRSFASPLYAGLALRLRARIAETRQGAAAALAIMQSEPDAALSEDARMYAASLMAETGDRAGAEQVWTNVVAQGTNASERAFVVSRVNLGGIALLRDAWGRAKTAEMRRLAGFALGRALTADSETRGEGVRLVRQLVREAPDAAGARECFAALAADLSRVGSYADAVEVYREIFETWPEALKSAELNDGYGWTLEQLGRYADARLAFARAEECAVGPAKAVEIVKQGDVLAAAGETKLAFEKYRQVLADYPESECAGRIKELVRLRDLEDRGRALYREYRFADAQKIFRQLGAEDPGRKSRMDYFDVLCLYGQGLDDEAEKKARRLAENLPDAEVRSELVLWLAKFSYNRGRWSEAGELFAAYADQRPQTAAAPEALVWAARAAFAESDFKRVVQTVTRLVERYPNSSVRVRGFLVQGEALIELARFDEAVLVLEQASLIAEAKAEDRLRAKVLRADALFAMGADNSARYEEALAAYRAVRLGESLEPSARLSIDYKLARTLEKLKRVEEAVDGYYTDVVLAYREGRGKGLRFDDEARAAFSRAALRLADEFESRGRDFQAIHILELLATSDVPAAAEAKKRIERIQRKGNFL